MNKVLLINDCRFESMIIKDALNSLGYTVKIASEYDALKQLKEYSADIVICNLIMKETSGDELINKIKLQKPETKCVLSSCNKISLKDYKDKRVDAVLHTPVESERLRIILSELSEISEVELAAIKQKLKERELKRKSLEVKEKETVSVTSKFAFCPFCGNKFDEGEEKFTFCPYCGHKLK